MLVPLSLVLRRLLRSLELGDDTARVLGTRAEAARLVLIAVAVVLTGLATAVAGPLVFVALVAGPIANRLLGPATGGLLAAALVGAALLLASDSSRSTCCRPRCPPAWSPVRSARRTCCGSWPPPTERSRG